MSEADPGAEARRWLGYARDDLAAAELLLNQPGVPPRYACFQAQQAAEKAIKVVLVYLQLDYPKRHDLDFLRDLVPEGWRVKTDHPDLARLTEWAVEARYPGDWADPTAADASRAVEQARAVVASVARDLVEHGFTDAE